MRVLHTAVIATFALGVVSLFLFNQKMTLQMSPVRALRLVSPSSSPTQAPRNNTIALLFTTFSDKPAKFKFFLSTIKNWATFLPDIQPVLFSTNLSSPLTRLAETHGWLVAHFTDLNKYGTPFLKPMYNQSYTMREAKLFGFANGDILFGKDLVHTLREISKHMPFPNATMVTGKRWNFAENCTSGSYNIWSPEQVNNLTRSNKTVLDLPWAEDYFFVSRDYPWHEIKDIVIARMGFDNYLIARSIQLGLTTIDASKTVSALHQCGHMKDRNNKMEKENLNYDKLVIGKRFPYARGRTVGIALVTRYDIFGNIVTTKRD